MALLPDGRIAVAEAGGGEGRLRLLDPRRSDAIGSRVAASSPPPAGVAVGPDFPSNRRLWWTRGASVVAVEIEAASATSAPPGTGRLGGTGEDGSAPVPVAVAELPGAAGPVAVGPDGRVYVGIAHTTLAAVLSRGRRESGGGAILRLNAEGTVPADNPRGPRDPVWASGLATPAGLDLDADGTVWVADSAAGRVARLDPGDDAGWPLVRGRTDDPLERIAAREIGPPFRAAAWAPDRGAPLAVAALRSPAWGATVAVGLDDGRVVRLRMEGVARGEANRAARDPDRPGSTARRGEAGASVRSGLLAGPLDGPVIGLEEGPDGRLWALTPATIWRLDPPGAAPFDASGGILADTVAPAPRPY